MLTVVILSNSVDGLQNEMQAADPYAEVFEWRVDALDAIDMDALVALRKKCSKPLIVTLRTKAQGGFSVLSRSERLLALKAFAALNPDYLDLESSDDATVLEEIHKAFPSVKLIRSSHDFSATPKDLDGVLKDLQHKAVDVYKIIGTAETVADSCRMIDFVACHAKSVNIVGHCMGPKGAFSRVLGAMKGNIFSYSQMQGEALAAPGIIPLTDMANLYRVPQLNADTQVFALLGDPVETSQGHILHNNVFGRKGDNRVYVKVPLTKDELGPFMDWAKQNNFKGFSITMPHKENIMAYVDELSDEAKTIGAVNTLKVLSDGVEGVNTDGAGAVGALENQGLVQGKSILMLGAGGAAKAIGFEALKRGARVTFLNRTLQKAKAVANDLGCQWIEKDKLSRKSDKKFDIIVNCLPQSGAAFIDRKNTIDTLLTPQGIVMDITYGLGDDELLNYAKSKGYKAVPGIEMFEKQAELQQNFWQN